MKYVFWMIVIMEISTALLIAGSIGFLYAFMFTRGIREMSEKVVYPWEKEEKRLARRLEKQRRREKR